MLKKIAVGMEGPWGAGDCPLRRGTSANAAVASSRGTASQKMHCFCRVKGQGEARQCHWLLSLSFVRHSSGGAHRQTTTMPGGANRCISSH